jgi:hypothetical protein
MPDIWCLRVPRPRPGFSELRDFELIYFQTPVKIQAVCRWQTDESLNIYACMGVKHYTALITQALAQSIDAGRASTLAEALPFIDISDLTLAQGDEPQHVDLNQEPDPDDDADD